MIVSIKASNEYRPYLEVASKVATKRQHPPHPELSYPWYSLTTLKYLLETVRVFALVAPSQASLVVYLYE